MAMICAHCGSNQTQAEVHEIFCFNCGRKTGFDGKALQPLARKPR